MIRAVLDTNILISGSLWSGTPRTIMDAVYHQQVRPLITEPMLDEVRDVIARPKFAARLRLLNQTADQIVAQLMSVMEVIEATPIEPTVPNDPDDDEILACAFSGGAHYIVTGDDDLLSLRSFRRIPIVTASRFLELLAS